MTLPPAYGAVVRFPSGVERLLLATIRDTAERAERALGHFNQQRAEPVELVRVADVIVEVRS